MWEGVCSLWKAVPNLPGSNLLFFILSVLGAVALRVGVSFLIGHWFRRLSPRTQQTQGYHNFVNSLSLLLPLLGVNLATPFLHLGDRAERVADRVLQILITAMVTWVLVNLSYVARDAIYEKHQVESGNNLRQRKLRTELQFFHRVLLMVIVIIGVSAILLSFESARRFGASLLASAGIASLIIGFAAQKSLGNLMAGLQIAFTQPIRLDDVVVVESEWGRIEEICLTYVVVRLWDLRTLILPINYFVEKPFQNWTRASADILGYAYIYADYSLPVEKVRDELQRVLEGDPRWDQRVCALQVTNATEHAIELRALMSARDASAAFDLRCEVRERLVTFIQREFPECLPKVRAIVGHEARATNHRGVASTADSVKPDAHPHPEAEPEWRIPPEVTHV